MDKHLVLTTFKDVKRFQHFYYENRYWTKTTKENRGDDPSNAFYYLYPWTFRLFDDDIEVRAVTRDN